MLKRRNKTRRRQRGVSNIIVQYPSAQVQGKNIPLAAVQGAPTVILNVRPTPFHTLIMHDPDAPGPKPRLHWLIINIPGSNFSEGHQLLGYYPPKPPSGIHKYKFTLYEQRFGHIQVPVPQPDNFNLEAFVHKNSLIKVDEVYMRVAAFNK